MIIAQRTVLLWVLISAAWALRAQTAPSAAPAAVAENPLTTSNRHIYGGAQQIVLRAAENMPEEHYGFKPVETVRTFGEIVGHIADAQYIFCSVVLGEKNPGLKIEKTKTSKADLIAALKESFTYCNRAYDGLTDVSATQVVKFMGGEKPKLTVLIVNEVHSIEHYGNLVTYMRMKNLVPPTSEPDFMKSLGK
jgi:uncharacterized damage-inducible protein DinB